MSEDDSKHRMGDADFEGKEDDPMLPTNSAEVVPDYE